MTTGSFHNRPLATYRFLITGGAGFIGSNLVAYLLQHGAGHIRILDNLLTGSLKNIEHLLKEKNIEFIEGDIRDAATCESACQGIDFVSHQAALGSVPRSIKDPLATHAINATGFLNMIHASKNNGVKRFVYASSSSVYGDHAALPKIEDQTGNPLSPYAVTKKTNELYDLERHKINTLESICAKEGMEPIIFNISEYMKSGALLSCMFMHLNYVDYTKTLI